MPDNILAVKNLTKDYGDFVLNDLSFSVPCMGNFSLPANGI